MPRPPRAAPFALRALRHPVVWLPACTALIGLTILRSDIAAIAPRLAGTNLGPLALAVGVNGVIVVLWSFRSTALLARVGHSVPVLSQAPMSAMAYAVNNATPASSGELVRLALLKHRHAVPYASGAAAVGVERVGALWYLAGTGLMASLATTSNVAWAFVLGTLVASGPLLAGAYAGRVTRLFSRSRLWSHGGSGGREAVSTPGARFGVALGRILGDWRTASSFALVSAGIFACFSIQLVLVAKAAGVEVDVFAAWGALSVSMLAGILSLLPFGLGAADLVLAEALTALGIERESAVVMTFGFRIVSTLPLGLAGAAAFGYLSSQKTPAFEPTGDG